MRRDIIVRPAKGLRLSAEVPGDKSISHRSIILAAIADGTSVVTNLLESEDCMRTAQIFRELGVKITKTGKSTYRIDGVGLHGLEGTSKKLYCGNSGTTMRLLTGLLASQNFTSVLTGDSSLEKRPMDRVVAPLERMGATIQGSGERKTAPLTILGGIRLRGVRTEMAVASAQVKSALLLAGLYAEGETTIVEKEATRDHTEIFFKKTGIPLSVKGRTIRLRPGKTPQAFHASVPGDVSSAAFLMAIGLIVPGSRIVAKNVITNPTRLGLVRVLKRMGAKITARATKSDSIEPTADYRMEPSRLRATTVRPSEIPTLVDELPVLMVIATQARGKTWIRGAGELRVKETDRIHSMTTQLAKMGAKIGTVGDDVWIEGPTPLRGVKVDSFADHRTAMSFIVAGLIAEGQTEIRDIANIATSFPTFLNLLKTSGASFKLSSK